MADAATESAPAPTETPAAPTETAQPAVESMETGEAPAAPAGTTTTEVKNCVRGLGIFSSLFSYVLYVHVPSGCLR
ncbi:unnamed protein product [Cylicostephanus goldi]|uniref:Uncharacterized protein n=1 Tax=Cylicostephanus goldi TaxID=71465 RepID=A0A3P6TH06_CYLGO|nr:unnamed protein product [Cylicostephanus goldi]